MKKLQVCEGQNPCFFVGAKYLIFCTSMQINSLKVIQCHFQMTMWFRNDNYELLVACGNCCWPHLGFTNVAQDIVQHITHARKKKTKKKKIGQWICHQWFIRSRVSARRLFPEVTHCPFMSEDTHALTDLPLVWIHGRINTSASKCFHFFSLFFPPLLLGCCSSSFGCISHLRLSRAWGNSSCVRGMAAVSPLREWRDRFWTMIRDNVPDGKKRLTGKQKRK